MRAGPKTVAVAEPPDVAAVRTALLAWYDRTRRPLPWRRSRDSYRVWVAETMLQQTRIAVVEPAYERFVARFPDLPSVAGASEDDVLALWSGLGYYSRARNLRRAAICLVEAGAREFPRDMQTARALPGVGAYTAAAVLSIAYRRPYAAIDGNVVRVLSRLARLARPDGRGRPHSDLADELLDRRRPGDWNQAVMELGETICMPKAARCEECPVAAWCAAQRHGDVASYPPPKPRPERVRHDVAFHVISDGSGNVVLERGAFAYLRHLWLPLVGAPDGRAGTASFRHAIVHRDFSVSVTTDVVSSARLKRFASSSAAAERRIFTPAELTRIGRSSLLTKALRAATAQPNEGRKGK